MLGLSKQNDEKYFENDLHAFARFCSRVFDLCRW